MLISSLYFLCPSLSCGFDKSLLICLSFIVLKTIGVTQSLGFDKIVHTIFPLEQDVCFFFRTRSRNLLFFCSETNPNYIALNLIKFTTEFSVAVRDSLRFQYIIINILYICDPRDKFKNNRKRLPGDFAFVILSRGNSLLRLLIISLFSHRTKPLPVGNVSSDRSTIESAE